MRTLQGHYGTGRGGQDGQPTPTPPVQHPPTIATPNLGTAGAAQFQTAPLTAAAIAQPTLTTPPAFVQQMPPPPPMQASHNMVPSAQATTRPRQQAHILPWRQQLGRSQDTFPPRTQVQLVLLGMRSSKRTRPRKRYTG